MSSDEHADPDERDGALHEEWLRAEFDLVEEPTCTHLSADLRPVVTVADALAAVDGWPMDPARRNSGAHWHGVSPMPSFDIRPRCWGCGRPYVGWPGEKLCRHETVPTFDDEVRPETRRTDLK